MSAIRSKREHPRSLAGTRGLCAAILLLCPCWIQAEKSEGHFGPTLHPGFEQGVLVGRGPAQSSIAFGDIDEDGRGEILIGGNDGGLYAFNDDGTPVVAPLEGKAEVILDATPGLLFLEHDFLPILSSPTLSDVDEDGRLDILWGTDGGEVYRLELLLSTDFEMQMFKSTSFMKKPTVKRSERRIRENSNTQESDDAGR